MPINLQWLISIDHTPPPLQDSIKKGKYVVFRKNSKIFIKTNLWEVIKDRVYATKPENLEQFKDAIISETQSLLLELCQRACQSVSERVQFRNDVEYKQFEHL